MRRRLQILFPLIQGTLWTLALTGWRFWNRNAQLQGTSLGTRIRRWWYEVNNWPVPQSKKSDKKLAGRVADVSDLPSLRERSCKQLFTNVTAVLHFYLLQ